MLCAPGCGDAGNRCQRERVESDAFVESGVRYLCQSAWLAVLCELLLGSQARLQAESLAASSQIAMSSDHFFDPRFSLGLSS